MLEPPAARDLETPHAAAGEGWLAVVIKEKWFEIEQLTSRAPTRQYSSGL